MAKPTPKRFDPSEVPALAAAVVKVDRFPYLATIDGDQPRLRPVSPRRGRPLAELAAIVVLELRRKELALTTVMVQGSRQGFIGRQWNIGSQEADQIVPRLVREGLALERTQQVSGLGITLQTPNSVGKRGTDVTRSQACGATGMRICIQEALGQDVYEQGGVATGQWQRPIQRDPEFVETGRG